MNNEKVKEIKELLEEEILIATSFDDKLRRVSTKFLQEILTLINELEEENKDYKDRCELIHDLGFDYDGSKTIEDFKILVDELVLVAINGAQVKKGIDNKLKTENQQFKNRVTELERENKDYYDRLNNLQTYIDNHEEIWKANTKMQLKQFAEKLKEKCEYNRKKYCCEATVSANDIGETLKEFINQDKNYTEVR